MFYGQFALKAQETRQKLYDEIRALEIQKSKLSKAPSVSSVPTPRQPLLTQPLKNLMMMMMRRLWDLWGVKIDSVWVLHFKRTSVSIPFCFFMPLGKGRDYHGREGSFVKKWKANE